MISVWALISVLVGSLCRMWYGWAKAKEAGEAFSVYKLQMSIVASMLAAVLYYIANNYSDVGILGGYSSTGFIKILAEGFIGGFVAERDFTKLLTAGATKIGIKGGS